MHTLATHVAGIALAALAPAQLSVVATSPPRNATAVDSAATVTMTFSAALDPASVDGRSFQVFGRWSGVGRGTVALRGGGREIAFVPERPFFPGEVVTVLATSAVRAAAGGNLARGHALQFWVRAAPGSGTFTLTATLPVRRTGEGRIQTYGAYAGDLDHDGAPDLALPNEIAGDVRVMRSDGCATFAAPVVHALPNGSVPSPIEGADFDGDGHTDVAISNLGGASVSILIGDGQGGFAPHVTYPVGNQPRGLAVLDVDADGDPDVVTANYSASNLALLRNRGDGTFDPAAFFEGGGNGERGLAAADADGDGVLDLIVGMYDSQTFVVLRGDGSGGYTPVASTSARGTPWMIAVGDLNGDGAVDVASANFQNNTAAVAMGTGSGGLQAASIYTAGSRPLAVDLGDLEGDGDLDLVISNYGGSSFMAWRNDGSGAFGQRVTYPAPRAGSCALVVDYDRDGDVDMVGIDEIADVVLLFTQNGPDPLGVQPPTCDAALRLDNLAMRAGYGGRAAHQADGRVLLGVSSTPAAAWVVHVGAALEPGPVTPFGVLNLDPLRLLPLLRGTTDAHGEDLVQLALPPTLPPGVPVALQAATVDAGLTRLRLSNSEQLQVR